MKSRVCPPKITYSPAIFGQVPPPPPPNTTTRLIYIHCFSRGLLKASAVNAVTFLACFLLLSLSVHKSRGEGPVSISKICPQITHLPPTPELNEPSPFLALRNQSLSTGRRSGGGGGTKRENRGSETLRPQP